MSKSEMEGLRPNKTESPTKFMAPEMGAPQQGLQPQGMQPMQQQPQQPQVSWEPTGDPELDQMVEEMIANGATQEQINAAVEQYKAERKEEHEKAIREAQQAAEKLSSANSEVEDYLKDTEITDDVPVAQKLEDLQNESPVLPMEGEKTVEVFKDGTWRYQGEEEMFNPPVPEGVKVEQVELPSDEIVTPEKQIEEEVEKVVEGTTEETPTERPFISESVESELNEWLAELDRLNATDADKQRLAKAYNDEQNFEASLEAYGERLIAQGTPEQDVNALLLDRKKRWLAKAETPTEVLAELREGDTLELSRADREAQAELTNRMIENGDKDEVIHQVMKDFRAKFSRIPEGALTQAQRADLAEKVLKMEVQNVDDEEITQYINDYMAKKAEEVDTVDPRFEKDKASIERRFNKGQFSQAETAAYLLYKENGILDPALLGYATLPGDLEKEMIQSQHIPDWAYGSDFLEGVHFTFTNMFPQAARGIDLAGVGSKLQQSKEALQQLKSSLDAADTPQKKQEFLNSKVRVGGSYSERSGTWIGGEMMSVEDAIKEHGKVVKEYPALLLSKINKISELQGEAEIYDNPVVFDEDGITFKDFKGMIGRQAPQLASSIATFGLGAFAQEYGHAYIENLMSIAAKKYNTETPTDEQLLEIIASGEDEAGIAVGTGAVSGMLEFVGAKQVVRAPLQLTTALIRGEFKKKLAQSGGNIIYKVGKEGLKGMLVEGLTEGAQGIAQDVGKSYATATNYKFDVDKFLEESAQGGIVGLTFGGGGKVISEGGYRMMTDPNGRKEVFDEQAAKRMMDEEQKAKEAAAQEKENDLRQARAEAARQGNKEQVSIIDEALDRAAADRKQQDTEFMEQVGMATDQELSEMNEIGKRIEFMEGEINDEKTTDGARSVIEGTVSDLKEDLRTRWEDISLRRDRLQMISEMSRKLDDANEAYYRELHELETIPTSPWVLESDGRYYGFATEEEANAAKGRTGGSVKSQAQMMGGNLKEQIDDLTNKINENIGKKETLWNEAKESYFGKDDNLSAMIDAAEIDAIKANDPNAAKEIERLAKRIKANRDRLRKSEANVVDNARRKTERFKTEQEVRDIVDPLRNVVNNKLNQSFANFQDRIQNNLNSYVNDYLNNNESPNLRQFKGLKTKLETGEIIAPNMPNNLKKRALLDYQKDLKDYQAERSTLVEALNLINGYIKNKSILYQNPTVDADGNLVGRLPYLGEGLRGTDLTQLEEANAAGTQDAGVGVEFIVDTKHRVNKQKETISKVGQVYEVNEDAIVEPFLTPESKELLLPERSPETKEDKKMAKLKQRAEAGGTVILSKGDVEKIALLKKALDKDTDKLQKLVRKGQSRGGIMDMAVISKGDLDQARKDVQNALAVLSDVSDNINAREFRAQTVIEKQLKKGTNWYNATESDFITRDLANQDSKAIVEQMRALNLNNEKNFFKENIKAEKVSAPMYDAMTKHLINYNRFAQVQDVLNIVGYDQLSDADKARVAELKVYQTPDWTFKVEDGKLVEKPMGLTPSAPTKGIVKNEQGNTFSVRVDRANDDVLGIKFEVPSGSYINNVKEFFIAYNNLKAINVIGGQVVARGNKEGDKIAPSESHRLFSEKVRDARRLVVNKSNDLNQQLLQNQDVLSKPLEELSPTEQVRREEVEDNMSKLKDAIRAKLPEAVGKLNEAIQDYKESYDNYVDNYNLTSPMKGGFTQSERLAEVNRARTARLERQIKALEKQQKANDKKIAKLEAEGLEVPSSLDLTKKISNLEKQQAEAFLNARKYAGIVEKLNDEQQRVWNLVFGNKNTEKAGITNKEIEQMRQASEQNLVDSFDSPLYDSSSIYDRMIGRGELDKVFQMEIQRNLVLEQSEGIQSVADIISNSNLTDARMREMMKTQVGRSKLGLEMLRYSMAIASKWINPSKEAKIPGAEQGFIPKWANDKGGEKLMYDGDIYSEAFTATLEAINGFVPITYKIKDGGVTKVVSQQTWEAALESARITPTEKTALELRNDVEDRIEESLNKLDRMTKSFTVSKNSQTLRRLTRSAKDYFFSKVGREPSVHELTTLINYRIPVSNLRDQKGQLADRYSDGVSYIFPGEEYGRSVAQRFYELKKNKSGELVEKVIKDRDGKSAQQIYQELPSERKGSVQNARPKADPEWSEAVNSYMESVGSKMSPREAAKAKRMNKQFISPNFDLLDIIDALDAVAYPVKWSKSYSEFEIYALDVALIDMKDFKNYAEDMDGDIVSRFDVANVENLISDPREQEGFLQNSATGESLSSTLFGNRLPEIMNKITEQMNKLQEVVDSKDVNEANAKRSVSDPNGLKVDENADNIIAEETVGMEAAIQKILQEELTKAWGVTTINREGQADVKAQSIRKTIDMLNKSLASKGFYGVDWADIVADERTAEGNVYTRKDVAPITVERLLKRVEEVGTKIPLDEKAFQSKFGKQLLRKVVVAQNDANAQFEAHVAKLADLVNQLNANGMDRKSIANVLKDVSKFDVEGVAAERMVQFGNSMAELRALGFTEQEMANVSMINMLNNAFLSNLTQLIKAGQLGTELDWQTIYTSEKKIAKLYEDYITTFEGKGIRKVLNFQEFKNNLKTELRAMKRHIEGVPKKLAITVGEVGKVQKKYISLEAAGIGKEATTAKKWFLSVPNGSLNGNGEGNSIIGFSNESSARAAQKVRGGVVYSEEVILDAGSQIEAAENVFERLAGVNLDKRQSHQTVNNLVRLLSAELQNRVIRSGNDFTTPQQKAQDQTEAELKYTSKKPLYKMVDGRRVFNNDWTYAQNTPYWDFFSGGWIVPQERQKETLESIKEDYNQLNSAIKDGVSFEEYQNFAKNDFLDFSIYPESVDPQLDIIQEYNLKSEEFRAKVSQEQYVEMTTEAVRRMKNRMKQVRQPNYKPVLRAAEFLPKETWGKMLIGQDRKTLSPKKWAKFIKDAHDKAMEDKMTPQLKRDYAQSLRGITEKQFIDQELRRIAGATKAIENWNDLKGELIPVLKNDYLDVPASYKKGKTERAYIKERLAALDSEVARIPFDEFIGNDLNRIATRISRGEANQLADKLVNEIEAKKHSNKEGNSSVDNNGETQDGSPSTDLQFLEVIKEKSKNAAKHSMERKALLKQIEDKLNLKGFVDSPSGLRFRRNNITQATKDIVEATKNDFTNRVEDFSTEQLQTINEALDSTIVNGLKDVEATKAIIASEAENILSGKISPILEGGTLKDRAIVIAAKLQERFPNVELKVLPGEDFKTYFESVGANAQFLENVPAFLFGNEVVLNLDKITPEAPIHEFGHVYVKDMKKNRRQLYDRGIELLKDSQEWKDLSVRREDPKSVYYQYNNEQFEEEVMATAIGRHGAATFKKADTRAKWKKWVADAWRFIEEQLGIGNLDKLTVQDFLNVAVAEMLSENPKFTKPELKRALEQRKSRKNLYGMLSNLENFGVFGTLANVLAPTANDDFAGLLSRVIPVRDKAARKRAQEVINNYIMTPLNEAKNRHLYAKAEMLDDFKNLKKSSFGSLRTASARLGVMSGLQDKFGNELTNSQVSMLYNYLKDPSLIVKLERGGIGIEQINQIINYVQQKGNEDLRRFTDGYPDMFRRFRKQIASELDKYKVDVKLEEKPINAEKLSPTVAEILRRTSPDGTMPQFAVYTPFTGASDASAIEIAEKERLNQMKLITRTEKQFNKKVKDYEAALNQLNNAKTPLREANSKLNAARNNPDQFLTVKDVQEIKDAEINSTDSTFTAKERKQYADKVAKLKKEARKKNKDRKEKLADRIKSLEQVVATRQKKADKIEAELDGIRLKLQEQQADEVRLSREISEKDAYGMVKGIKDPFQAYTVMSDNLKERTAGGSVDIIGKNINEVISKYADGPLRTMSYLGFAKNLSAFFNTDNFRRAEAKLGEGWAKSMRNSIRMVVSGDKNNGDGPSEIQWFYRWMNRGIGTTMFLNVKSALLQQLSILNFATENPIAYMKHIGNRKHMADALDVILNSGFVRLRGNEQDLVMEDLGNQKGRDPLGMGIDWMLRKGYFLTKSSDKLAIIRGGQPFVAYKIQEYLDEGMNLEDAKKAAQVDFTRMADTAQQSTSPDKLGRAQTSKAGRYMLAYLNAVMQFNRIIADSIRKANAGENVVGNLSKASYYLTIQMGGFTLLQQAMWTLFDDDDDWTEKDKISNMIHSMRDSIMSSVSLYGALLSTGIEALRAYQKAGYNKWEKAMEQAIGVVPSFSTKYRQLKTAFDTKKKIYKNSNMKISGTIIKQANALQAITGVPAKDFIDLLEMLHDGVYYMPTDPMFAILRLLGWGRYELAETTKGKRYGDVFDNPLKKLRDSRKLHKINDDDNYIDLEKTSFYQRLSPAIKLWDREFDSTSPLRKLYKLKEVEDGEPGVLGRADKDGTITVNPNLPPALKRRVVAHETRHAKDLESGKLSYTDNDITWDGKSYPRKDGKIKYDGKWLIEGSKEFPWEKVADKAENNS